VAASRSTERPSRRLLAHAIGQGIRGMGADERLAAMGALIVCGSLLLPWYGAPIADDLVQTGVGAFSFAEAALVLTAVAALVLCLQLGRGYEPPRPLSEGGLLIAAGVWIALILVYRMLDRPEFTLIGFDEPYLLRYGIFVALTGAFVLLAAGMQARRGQRSRRDRAPRAQRVPGA
jgi:hypothetical protein